MDNLGVATASKKVASGNERGCCANNGFESQAVAIWHVLRISKVSTEVLEVVSQSHTSVLDLLLAGNRKGNGLVLLPSYGSFLDSGQCRTGMCKTGRPRQWLQCCQAASRWLVNGGDLRWRGHDRTY
jgi:hypothetical protein